MNDLEILASVIRWQWRGRCEAIIASIHIQKVNSETSNKRKREIALSLVRDRTSELLKSTKLPVKLQHRRVYAEFTRRW